MFSPDLSNIPTRLVARTSKVHLPVPGQLPHPNRPVVSYNGKHQLERLLDDLEQLDACRDRLRYCDVNRGREDDFAASN